MVIQVHTAFPRRTGKGENKVWNARWTLDPGFPLLPLVAPQEAVLVVMDSEKSQGQTQCPKFQNATLVPALSQLRGWTSLSLHLLPVRWDNVPIL